MTSHSDNSSSATPPTSATSGTVPHSEFHFGTTPNFLSLFRIALVPAVVLALYQQTTRWDQWATFFFIVASITDYLDGYLARSQKTITIYGKLLDPLADKFLVVSALIMLQWMGRIEPFIVILLVCREIAITGLRAMASAEGLVISASESAKWKTFFQMAAIPMLMLKEGLFGIPVFQAGQVLLILSLSLSLWTAKDYIVHFFRAIQKRRAEVRKTKGRFSLRKKGFKKPSKKPKS